MDFLIFCITFPKLDSVFSFVGCEHFCSSSILMCTLLEFRTPLHAAAYSGNVAGLQLVLAQGAQVNAVDHCGCSALMVAAACGQTRAVGMCETRKSFEMFLFLSAPGNL